MARILLTVSISVSPFEIEDSVFVKFIMSALNLFSANSKDNFVLVEFSKNKFAIVTPLRVGTFFIFLFKIYQIIPSLIIYFIIFFYFLN